MFGTDIVFLDLKASSRKQALRELAEETAKLYGGDEERLFHALIERENIGSTSIGNGVAIPHVRLPEIDVMMGIFVRLEEPVAFEAFDNKPVDLIFLLLAPEASIDGLRLKVLARLSRFFKNKDICICLLRGLFSW